ncbi:MAG: HIT family protein [Alphaproteobacteria bacterium]|nr:MAG: HIT family protein [Alphaproteobacteria bacterium]
MTDTAQFTLHPRLAADCEVVMDLPISRLLLIRDARYPWIILVPRHPHLKELHQLNESDYRELAGEIKIASQLMAELFKADKVNVGALGNLVPQLHIHVIARNIGDAAWPGPVWGQGEAEAYDAGELEKRSQRIRDAFTKIYSTS